MNRDSLDRGEKYPEADSHAWSGVWVGFLVSADDGYIPDRKGPQNETRKANREDRHMALERFDEQLVFEKVKAEYARLLREKDCGYQKDILSRWCRYEHNQLDSRCCRGWFMFRTREKNGGTFSMPAANMAIRRLRPLDLAKPALRTAQVSTGSEH